MLPPPMGPMAHRAVPFNRRERRRERSRGGLEVGRNVTAGGGKGPRGNRVEKGEKSGRDPGWRAAPLPLAPGLRQPLKDGRGGRRRSGGLPGAGGRPPSPASTAALTRAPGGGRRGGALPAPQGAAARPAGHPPGEP